MQAFMSETERWRSSKVAELNGKILDIANKRADILHPYAKAAKRQREQLAKLEGDSATAQFKATIKAVEREMPYLSPTQAFDEAVKRRSDLFAQARREQIA
jgi:excinuclease UvrABC helicase subunit UvrB